MRTLAKANPSDLFRKEILIKYPHSADGMQILFKNKEEQREVLEPMILIWVKANIGNVFISSTTFRLLFEVSKTKTKCDITTLDFILF